MNLWLSSLLLAATAWAGIYGQLVQGPGGTTKKPFLNPVKASINNRGKTVDADFPGGTGWDRARPERTRMKAETERVELLLRQKQQQLVAGAKDGFVAADGGQGDRAAGSLYRENGNGDVKGGLVSAGGERALMKNSEDGNTENANFEAAGKSLNTNVVNSGQPGALLNAVDPLTGKDYQVRSDAQNGQDGHGEITYSKNNGGSDGNLAYNVRQNNADDTYAKLENKDSGYFIGRNVKSYECTTKDAGGSETTECKDSSGNYVGKAITNQRGESVVFGPAGNVVGRGHAVKKSDDQFNAVINDGLFEAKTTKLKEINCFDTVNAKHGGSGKYRNASPVKIQNAQVKYNSQRTRDGVEVFNWPDCLTMTADVTLPPGVAYNRLAYELVMHVLPMGKYDCTDAGTCPNAEGRNCYYCDLCEKQKTVEVLSNTYGEECEMSPSQGTAKRVSRTICPTPAGTELEMCNGFDRHILGNDYYKYDGSINAEVRFWLMPENIEELRKTFASQYSNPITKLKMISDYKVAKGKAGSNQFNLDVPEEYELWHHFLQGKDDLVYCKQTIIDYSLGGDDVKPNVALDWFAQAGKMNDLKLFKSDKCPEWENVQKETYEEAKPASSGNTGGLSSLLGNFGGLFGGGRG